MDNANVALAKRMYDAFGRGDIAMIVNTMTADSHWETVGRAADFPTLGTRRGRPGVQKFFDLVGTNLKFSEFSPKEFYAAGDKVFVLGRYAATATKTGKSFASDWCHIFTIRDGQVTSFREFTDTAQLAEAHRG
jgi:ketosteroid isomerase-like protein